MSTSKKIIYVLVLTVIFLLVILVSFITYKVATIENSLNIIIQQQDSLKVIKGINGKNGYTPIKGIDYFDGAPGKDGTNAISTNTVVEKDTTTVQEVPLQGTQGAQGEPGTPGKDAPELEIQIDPTTGNLETKYSTDAIWNTLVPCQQLLVSCPGSSQ